MTHEAGHIDETFGFNFVDEPSNANVFGSGGFNDPLVGDAVVGVTHPDLLPASNPGDASLEDFLVDPDDPFFNQSATFPADNFSSTTSTDLPSFLTEADLQGMGLDTSQTLQLTDFGGNISKGETSGTLVGDSDPSFWNRTAAWLKGVPSFFMGDSSKEMNSFGIALRERKDLILDDDSLTDAEKTVQMDLLTDSAMIDLALMTVNNNASAQRSNFWLAVGGMLFSYFQSERDWGHHSFDSFVL
jgi:hypothetical protein